MAGRYLWLCLCLPLAFLLLNYWDFWSLFWISSSDAAAGGKSSKKNAKRQAARAKKRLLQDVEPSSSTPVSVEATATPQAVAPRPSAAPAGRSNVQSRVAALKEEMAAAKASGVSSSFFLFIISRRENSVYFVF